MNNSLLLQNIDAFQSAVSRAQSIGIVVSAQQNLDKLAAGLALFLSLSQTGKNVQIVSAADPIVEHSNLVGIDKIKRSLSGGKTNTIIVSVPFREGEVEKVSYNTEGDRMNFSIIGGSEGIHPFSIQDVKIINQGSTPDVVISIGISNPEDLSQFIAAASATSVVNLDNSAANSRYGIIQFVDSGFSSICEIVTIILQELALPLDVDTAQNLMDGVSYATKDFLSPQTGSFAFESAAILLRVGAKRSKAHPPTAQQQDFLHTNETNNSSIKSFPSHQQSKAQQFSSGNLPHYDSMSVENKETKPLSDEDAGQPEDIPSDWFIPKVFKGSRKPSQ